MGPALSIVLVLVSAPGPDSSGIPAPQRRGCWVDPLELTLVDVALMGRIAKQVAESHCYRRRDADAMRHMRHPYTVGRMRFASFTLFGRRLHIGLDVVVNPSEFGNDTMFAAPALDLPEEWELAIDRATYPVLILGSAALLTAVVVNLLQ